MSYQVIARKYRPQKFADVVGQEHVTQTLANAIRQNRIAHAYLFVGPRGTGKTTLARIFSKCLNCTGGPKVEFADDDPRCKEIAEGRSLDVLEIDGASNRGIEEIRELRETVKYAPATSKFKIYIIDEVHMLTKEAFNALLKTLEEPPEHVKFMFATTEPEKVLPTILSRCQRFDLRRIPTALIVKHLAFIAKQENVKIDDAALYAIARGAEGGMRDAESTLDQLISFCGSEIVEGDVLSMFGLAARSQIMALAEAVLSGQSEAAFRELNNLTRSGKDLGRLLTDLLNHLRNLLLYQIARGDLSLLEVSEAEADTLTKQAGLVSSEALTRIMEILTEAESRLKDTASKKILLEVTLLKAAQARDAISIDTLLRKLQDLRNGIPSQAVPSTSPASALPASRASAPTTAATPAPAPVRSTVTEPKLVPSTPAPATSPAKKTVESVPQLHAEAASPAPGDPAALNLRDVWTRVLEGVGSLSQFARSYLIHAHPVSLVKNIFTIGFSPAFADQVGLVDNPKNRTLIQDVLGKIGYPQAHVKIVIAEPPADWVEPTPEEIAATAPAKTQASPEKPAAAAPETKKPKVPEPIMLNKDDFKNDPLIKQALEIFKGTIVEVRT